jgi:hypothetical protein
MTNHKKRYMAQVMHGTIDKTPGGLTKKDIKTIHKDGKVHYVSKRRSIQAKKNLGGWNKAVKQAKKNLGIPTHSFETINRGSDLYKEAARLYYD